MQEPERDGARRGRGYFQQEIIRDSDLGSIPQQKQIHLLL